jgi:hypothetical protein
MNDLFTWIDKIREKKVFRFFYWLARISMGFTFIVSGVRKLPGVRFTALPESNPVGAYFQAMYETGFYWNSIGVIQIVLGLLIFWNRTVVLSSLLMMPVTINIFLISVALQMRGTPLISFMLVMANLFLLLWHFENYRPILSKPKH